MRLPKPLYESMPFILIGTGIVFLSLVLNRYEYAPTLMTWFTGLACIICGLVVLGARIYSRRQRVSND